MPRDVFGPDHAFLPREEILSFEEIRRLVEVFACLGVTKVGLTAVSRCVETSNRHCRVDTVDADRHPIESGGPWGHSQQPWLSPT
jgi:hypothetical protein